jgi:putative spermidine/putrescine transport system permease protein
METRLTRHVLRGFTILVVIVMFLPLVVIALFAFNASKIQAWPITSWSTHWWSVAWQDQDVRAALLNSIKAGIGATAIALVLGTLAAFAVSRYKFFGRNVISLALVLPIALPGIVTGVALRQTFLNFNWNFGLTTIIIGHATFCVVTVYNNVVARLRRTSTSLGEASQDLGATGWQTFWYVTLPNLRSALVAGGLLAFALSFDEIVVTHFTAGAQNTLPTWVLDNLGRAQARPKVNVVAFVVILLSIIPVYFAQRLTADAGIEGATKG